jgi:hypothetical protein
LEASSGAEEYGAESIRSGGSEGFSTSASAPLRIRMMNSLATAQGCAAKVKKK